MANRYANLIGSNKIKDEYTKINAGFDAVQTDIDNLSDDLSAHKADAVAHVTQAEHDKLAGIEPGAQVNQNAFSRVNDVQATTEEDALTVEGGTGIMITTDPAQKRLIITATGEATPGPHASSHITGGTDVIPDAVPNGSSGLMSGADKAKLDALPNDVQTQLDDIRADIGDMSTVPTTSKVVAGAISELFQSVSDGKTLIAGAITDKGVPTSPSDTFATMAANIQAIPTGDYSVGDTITDIKLRLDLTKGMGKVVWANSEVNFGRGVDVDSIGNVYTAHNVTSGKTIRKLDPTGNEVWANTEVPQGRGVAVDANFNVYVVNLVTGANKTIRKFDPDGNEIWAITGLSSGGVDIKVDSSGNVYTAHSNYIRKYDSEGNEKWVKSDVTNGSAVAVDESGNVYAAYTTSSSGVKCIRKLDPSGNEIWAKTDEILAVDVAVDSNGYVYAGHGASATKKLRRLTPDGNEVWARTDLANVNGLAVDVTDHIYATTGQASPAMSILKLDAAGYTLWSATLDNPTTNVAVGVDGYVGVASSPTIYKLDGRRYYTITG